MPTTRRQKPKQRKDTVDALDVDDILQLSQSSDDAGLVTTVLQQYQTTLDKKRREKEPKFLRALQRELDNTITTQVDECITLLGEIGQRYDRFVLDYAAAEDKIRLLHEELEQECLRLLIFMDQRHKSVLEREKQREKSHIKALAATRKSCEDFRHLIESFANIYEA